MFLRYLKSAPDAEALLMRNNQAWCVEVFVLRNNDDSYSLVALSGVAGARARRRKLQGPFQTRDQALASRSAVAQQLQDTGFTIDTDALPQWRLSAQRMIRELREERRQGSPDCRFDPKDVY